jgi:hypothetical protein
MSRATSAEVVTDLRTWVEDTRPTPSPALTALLEPVTAPRAPSVPRPALRRAVRVGLVVKLTAVIGGLAVTAAAAAGVAHVVAGSGRDLPEPGLTAAPTAAASSPDVDGPGAAPLTSASAHPVGTPSTRATASTHPAPTTSPRRPSGSAGTGPVGRHRPAPTPRPSTSDGGGPGSGDPTSPGDGSGDHGGTPTSDPSPGDSAAGTTD